MNTMQTKQATTGVVAVVRTWSGTGALAPKAAVAYPAISIDQTPNHSTDVFGTTRFTGTSAWSPPV